MLYANCNLWMKCITGYQTGTANLKTNSEKFCSQLFFAELLDASIVGLPLTASIKMPKVTCRTAQWKEMSAKAFQINEKEE